MVLKMKILCIVCLIFIGDISFANRVDAKFVTEEQCIQLVKSVETEEQFTSFAKKLFPDDNVDLDEQDAAVLNRCLNSSNGLEDMKLMMNILEQGKTISYTTPELVDQVLEFQQQMKANTISSKKLFGKQKHRLSHFYKMFANDIMFHCRNSWGPTMYEHYASLIEF